MKDAANMFSEFGSIEESAAGKNKEDAGSVITLWDTARRVHHSRTDAAVQEKQPDTIRFS